MNQYPSTNIKYSTVVSMENSIQELLVNRSSSLLQDEIPSLSEFSSTLSQNSLGQDEVAPLRGTDAGCRNRKHKDFVGPVFSQAYI